MLKSIVVIKINISFTYNYLTKQFKINKMKQVTILKNGSERRLCVNKEEICVLRPIRNAVKEGCDSRDKYYVWDLGNSFNVRPFIYNARSIKEVVKYFEKLINKAL